MEYRSIARDARIEHEILRSRFIGIAARLFSLDDFAELVREQRREHPDAAHVCSAAIIGEHGESSRSSDDGEPSGTAGAPMLQAIVRRELTDVGVIVVRYFGGTKLGAGGLLRAYSNAASDALSAAGRVQRIATKRLLAQVDLAEVGRIDNALRTRGFEPAVEYGSSAHLAVDVDASELAGVQDQLRSLGILTHVGEDGYREVTL
ncbi:MAG TPA: IMPACT family protein [Candidatus Agrococcus pullicola]|uniref:IMPACT family protein n=1 Tax=Candidatus Agrococcus pullicola TaxID=2838429 RepID=A0A9D1YTN8_9MICO|nr:IMPACT family protein [Candidatus Agrococcus pullicola]